MGAAGGVRASGGAARPAAHDDLTLRFNVAHALCATRDVTTSSSGAHGAELASKDNRIGYDREPPAG